MDSSSSSSSLSTIMDGGVSAPEIASASRSDPMPGGIGCGPMKLRGGASSGVSAVGLAMGTVEAESANATDPSPLSLVRKMPLFCTTTTTCDSLTTP